MAGLLEGKVVAITGSGRGIGRETAILAASEGASVVINDPGVNPDGTGHDAGPAQQVADEINAAGGKAVANTQSVATMAGGESVIQSALDSFGKLDILVNAAAILRDRMIFNMSEAEWDEVILVDLKGHFTTTKPASVIMRQQRYGRIINFSSVSGLGGNSGQANYGAAKGGVAALTRVAARDLGRYGVTVNCIAPGAATRLTLAVPQETQQLRAQRGIASAAGGSAESNEERTARMAMQGPDMVAPMVVYLMLDEAWNINGSIFHVAGGTVGLLAHPYPPIRTIYKGSRWTLDELRNLVPGTLLAGLANPAPPPNDLSVPGRPV